jgi:hypothetical protein
MLGIITYVLSRISLYEGLAILMLPRLLHLTYRRYTGIPVLAVLQLVANRSIGYYPITTY